MCRIAIKNCVIKQYDERYCQIAFTSKYGSKTDVFSLGLILAELCIVMTSEERAKVWYQYFFINCFH